MLTFPCPLLRGFQTFSGMLWSRFQQFPEAPAQAFMRARVRGSAVEGKYPFSDLGKQG